MAVQTIVVTVCDLCGSDKGQTRVRRVGVDRWVRKLDACGGCWSEVQPVLDRLRSAGRRIPANA